jgi:aspartate racemase
LDGVEVIAPTEELTEVHEAYVAMASAGVATAAHREVFMCAGTALTRTHGCESILLAGTDLALVFGKGTERGFEVLDCAEAHAAVIALAALTGPAVG